MDSDAATRGRLSGKVAIITGAAGGIGEAAVRRFAAEGAVVIAADRDEGRLRELADSVDAPVRPCTHDVTSEEGWRSLVSGVCDEHDRLDVLINNAGVFHAAPLTETSLADYRRVVEVNQVGVFLGMRAVAPAMIAAGGGSIVNVSSVAGLRGGPLLTAYAASKWAVRGMSKVAAMELARHGVRVNSVHPGQIDTDMNSRQREATPELVERLVRSIPMGRIGTAAEIADALVFLASDESVYVSGSELAVDGATTA